MIREPIHWLLSTLVSGVAPLIVVGALTTGVVFFAGDSFSHETVDQPVLFNHLRHVDEVGLDCSSCHTGCEEAVSSGFPAMAACALCHSEPQGDSAAEQEFVAMIEAGAEVQWQSLFQQPAHVFFSHRRHTQVAGLECDECHGDIGQSTAPPRSRAPLSMERCIDCHEQRGAPSDCSTCHR